MYHVTMIEKELSKQYIASLVQWWKNRELEKQVMKKILFYMQHQHFFFLNRQILFSSRLCKKHKNLADQKRPRYSSACQ